MAALSFPTNPTLNQTYTVETKTWIWDGSAWVIKFVYATGPTGPQGPSGEAAFSSFLTMGA